MSSSIQPELGRLLSTISNTQTIPDPRNIDRYINPRARRIWKACDQIIDLADRGKLGVTHIPRLLEVGSTGNAHVKGSIGLAIGRIGPAGIPVLLEFLERTDDAALMAADALGSIGAAALPILEGLVTRSVHTRSKAMIAIVSTGAIGLPALTRLLRDDNSDVRRMAAVSLAIWGGLQKGKEKSELHEGVQVLLTELKNPNDRVNETAALGLGFQGGEALQRAMSELPLRGILPEFDWKSPHNEQLSMRLHQALQSSDPHERTQAARDAAELGNPAANAFLLPALKKETDPDTRGQLFATIWRLSKMS